MQWFQKISYEEVINALSKRELEVGIIKYTFIMEMFEKVDVRYDSIFKVVFIDFYKIINVSPIFLEQFFQTLENHKNEEYDYRDVLRKLYKYSKKIHGSFASKLLATVNPKLPIVDKFIKRNLELEEYYGVKNVENVINQYEEIKLIYDKFLLTETSKKWISAFDYKFPNRNIEDIKKIDFILWQIR